MTYYWVFLLLTLIQLSISDGVTNCSFNDLVQYLNNDTAIPSSNVRPVLNWSIPTLVEIDMSLYTVVDLDMIHQSLTTYVWFSMDWQNEFIDWEPDNFCGIKRVSITASNLWIPDFYIHEMTEADDTPPVIPYYFVYSNGDITNSMPIRIVSTCTLDVYKFPFDTQTCYLTFGPYIHTVKDIIMVPKLNSSQVKENSQRIFMSKGDWTLIDISVTNKTVWDKVNFPFSKVAYKIVIKRASLAYVINFIVPACFLIILDMFSMFIEMGTGERLGFKMTVILGFTVLLYLMSDMQPSSDNTPILGTFCCVCLTIMVISIFGCIATSYMLMLSATKPNVPPWIKIWVMERLARILCFKTKFIKQEIPINDAGSDDTNDKAENREIAAQGNKEIEETLQETLQVKLLKRLLLEILKIHEDLILSKDENEAKSEWYIVATVVDRLVLILYIIIVTVMFTVVISVWVT